MEAINEARLNVWRQQPNEFFRAVVTGGHPSIGVVATGCSPVSQQTVTPRFFGRAAVERFLQRTS